MTDFSALMSSKIAMPTQTADSASTKKTLSPEKLQMIEDKAKEFESVFMSEMLKPMFESVKVNEMFGGGKTEEVFRGFMRDEYGKMLAGFGGLGLADQIKQSLIDMQEKADSNSGANAVAQNMQGISG